MNGISSWSIRNPVPTIVLFVVLTLAGLFGFERLRINNAPDIDQPTVTVTVTQPGASPSELELQVTQIIENAVRGLNGVDTVSSTITEGSSTTTVEFNLGTNTETATNDVRNAVDSVAANLPASSNAPLVAKVNFSGGAIVTFVVDAPAMSPPALSWFVDDAIAKALLKVKDVSKVERSGGVDRIIRLKLDADRLAALGITVAEVSTALAGTNVNQPGGRMTIGGQEQTVRTIGSAQTIEGLRESRIAIAGNQIRLADLGSIDDSWAEPRQLARLDGKDVVAFNIYRTLGSSEIDVVKAARAAVAGLARKYPDATFREVTSSSGFVQESYNAAVEALLIGALLAIGVVWLFLRDLRATIVSAVALPLSLIPTFAVLHFLNISLNTITLLALSLVVGLLVDDAIVEIENIIRHMRQSGMGAYDAAIEAADEIGLAVVATTATIVAVFMPVAFMAGIPGQFFKDFAVATCVSVVFSLIVARMLTPLMGAYLVRARGQDDDTPRWIPAYLAILRAALNHRWMTLSLGVAFFVGSLLLSTMLSTEFMPATDRGRSIISVTLPAGSTLLQTDKVVKSITARLADEPEVEDIFASEGTPSSAGFGPGSGTSTGSVNAATVTVNLKPRGQRGSQQEFERRVTPALSDIPGARIQFGGGGQSGETISVTLTGADSRVLSRTSDKLISEIAGIAGLSSPTSTGTASRPELLITPDSTKAAEAGITTSAIASTIDIATLGDADRNLAKFNLGDRQISIVASLADDGTGSADKIATLPIKGANATVPLGAVASIGFGSGPTSIERIDGQRDVTVEAKLNGLTLGEAAARIAALPTMSNLPAGIIEVKQGDQARLAELLSGFVTAIATGILLMYGTLVLLFRGFIQPITILVALPLAVAGALGMLLVTGHSLSLTALIGILMLMGIAAKNSILLVEYALVARAERGLDRAAALLEAASKRARPIVMTSIAMGLGMLPIALGFGADSESRAPMAIAVIGGLITSTLLSLVYVPVFFTFMDDLEVWLSRRLGKLVVNRSTQTA